MNVRELRKRLTEFSHHDPDEEVLLLCDGTLRHIDHIVYADPRLNPRREPFPVRFIIEAGQTA